MLRRIEHGRAFIRCAGSIRQKVRNSQTRPDGIERFDVCAIDPQDLCRLQSLHIDVGQGDIGAIRTVRIE